jgi:hypothetical protein
MVGRVTPSRSLLLPLLGFTLSLAACSRPAPSPDPAPSATSAPAPAPPSAEPAEKPAESIAADWDVPRGWEAIQGTATDRRAIFRVRAAPGDTEDAYFSVETGGTAPAIVARWAARLAPAKPGAPAPVERAVGAFRVTTAELHGGAEALLGAVVAGPQRFQAEQALAAGEKKLAELRGKLTEQHPDVLAALAQVEGMRKHLAAQDEAGDGPLALSLRGPEKTVMAARGDFAALVGSLRAR